MQERRALGGHDLPGRPRVVHQVLVNRRIGRVGGTKVEPVESHPIDRLNPFRRAAGPTGEAERRHADRIEARRQLSPHVVVAPHRVAALAIGNGDLEEVQNAARRSGCDRVPARWFACWSRSCAASAAGSLARTAVAAAAASSNRPSA